MNSGAHAPRVRPIIPLHTNRSSHHVRVRARIQGGKRPHPY